MEAAWGWNPETNQILPNDGSQFKKCLVLLEMSSSWNFPGWAKPSYGGSEQSRTGTLQFQSWNRADNMYVKKLQIFTPT